MKDTSSSGKIAAILVRSIINVRPDVAKTLDLLKLRTKNVCVIIENNPANRGMISVVKDYITWGIIDAETEKELIAKRGNDSNFFRLNPPIKGFGTKGIKKPFKTGGALGDRKEKINDLIKRMI